MKLGFGSTLLFLAAVFPLPALAQGRVTYCCNTESGRQVCSDQLPKECYGRAYREISPSGFTIRHVAAPLTPEQRRVKEAEERRLRHEETRRKEEDRRNRILLATYSSEADIDYARDRTLADMLKVVDQARKKLAEHTEQQKKLDEERARYGEKPLPQELQGRLGENRNNIRTQEAIIEDRLKDIEQVRARYEEDKQRYRALSQKRFDREPEASTERSAPATRQ